MSEDMVQFVDAFRQLAVLQFLLCSYTVANHKVTNKLDGTYAINRRLFLVGSSHPLKVCMNH